MKPLQLDAAAWKFIADELAAPFDESEVKFRPGGRGSSLVYADARTYQDRFDYVVGVQNWEVSHNVVELTDLDSVDVTDIKAPNSEKWPNGKYKKPIFAFEERHYGGIETRIRVFGVTKEDVGKASNTEQLKGAYSDGFKRAATLWGLGKYFYTLGSSHSDTSTFPDFAIPKNRPDFDAVVEKLMEAADKNHPDYATVVDGWVPGLPLVYVRQMILDLRKLKAGANAS